MKNSDLIVRSFLLMIIPVIAVAQQQDWPTWSGNPERTGWAKAENAFLNVAIFCLSVRIGPETEGKYGAIDTAGVLGYKLKPSIIRQTGCRYLDVNYRPRSTFVYDTVTSGLLLGATFNLKT